MFKNLNPAALGISGHQSEIIELALTFGFAGMDLDVADFATRAKLRGMPYARRLIDSARVRSKLRIGTFELPFNCDTDGDEFQKDLARLPDYAAAAAAVGCMRCVTTLPPAGDKRPYHENFEFHRGRFAEVCAALQPSGIRFGIGFQAPEYLRKEKAFQFIHDFDSLTLLMKMVDAPNIGVLLDTWDLVACGASGDAIRGLRVEQIVAVQVADIPADVPMANLDKDSRLLPGAEGSQVHTAGILATLAEMGYDGPVSVKPSRRAFQSRRRDLVVKQTAEALSRVFRAAGLEAGPPPMPVAAVAHAAVEPAAPAAEPEG